MALPVMPTRILIVGGGAREHALAWKLAAEPGVNEVVVAPGNDAMAAEPRVRCVALPATDARQAVVGLARREAIELVVVGPEEPLADGLVDALEAAGVLAFGPSAAAARIETSKSFCHEIAAAAGVRMASAVVARSRAEAGAAVDVFRADGRGYVLKEDGLAAGKGVAVFGPHEADRAAAADRLEALFAAPGRVVLVEERLGGPEASVIALCDGRTALALPAARDHKRLGDGDDGPNTGGMGAYSPLPDLSASDVERILATVHRPILAELARRGTPFRGALYAGLILTAEGPALLECNARFGDPETEAIVPRLAVPLGPLLRAAAAGALPPTIDGRLIVPVLPGATVAIVLAGRGYPARSADGDAISGLDEAAALGGIVFHAGSRRTEEGGFVTHGGRIVTVVGRGPDLATARAVAERATGAIVFAGLQRRHDIGFPVDADRQLRMTPVAAPVAAGGGR
ncbi:MAG: phosphoribosylamine--glycine ligase [Candidatus Limnocylindrales bacterium]